MPLTLPHPPFTVNQDCACISYPLAADVKSALFIVLDGHGKKGQIVSAEALHRLHSLIDDCHWGDASLNESKLIDVFHQVQDHLQTSAANAAGVPAAQSSGAVGVALLLREGMLWVAHVGDCRAVIGQTNGRVIALTEDHTPDVPSEQARIQAMGAYVRPEALEPSFEPCRVYFSEDEQWRGPGLMMSRCFGDLDAVEAGVISTPQVSSRKLQAEDKFIVLASDGLWEVLVRTPCLP